jgi:hypothetical protein
VYLSRNFRRSEVEAGVDIIILFEQVFKSNGEARRALCEISVNKEKGEEDFILSTKT